MKRPRKKRSRQPAPDTKTAVSGDRNDRLLADAARATAPITLPLVRGWYETVNSRQWEGTI